MEGRRRLSPLLARATAPTKSSATLSAVRCVIGQVLLRPAAVRNRCRGNGHETEQPVQLNLVLVDPNDAAVVRQPQAVRGAGEVEETGRRRAQSHPPRLLKPGTAPPGRSPGPPRGSGVRSWPAPPVPAAKWPRDGRTTTAPPPHSAAAPRVPGPAPLRPPGEEGGCVTARSGGGYEGPQHRADRRCPTR